MRQSDAVIRADDPLSRGSVAPSVGGSLEGGSGVIEDNESTSLYSGIRSHKRIGTRGNGLNGPSIPSKVVPSQLRALRVPGSSSHLPRDLSPQGSVASSIGAGSFGNDAYILKGGFKMPKSSGSLNGGGSVSSSF
jgi:hypothetical protein